MVGLIVVWGAEGANLAVLGIVLGASLLLTVPVPSGGALPVGYALAIAIAARTSPLAYVSVLALALLLITSIVAAREGGDRAARRLLQWTLAATACFGAARLTL